MNLIVACVWVQNHIYNSFEWVGRLQRMVGRSLSVPHKFVCVTPHRPPCEIVRPGIVPPEGAPGWWYKVNLFNLKADRVLYLDLDVAVLGDLTPLVDFPSDFAVAPSSGVPMRGHDFNSSVMVWNPDSTPVQFIRSKLKNVPFFQHAGDQQWLSSLPIRVDLFPSRWIRKYLPKGGVAHPPEGTIVSLLTQCGKNQALIDAGHSWIQDYWR